MAGQMRFGGKRELLARGLLWSGASFLLTQLSARDSLLVLCYHRIGNANDDLYDPFLFSATAEQFDDQLSYLKRRLSLVTLEEALSFIDGTCKDKAPRCRVLVTFDDGYLDNYEIAYPILRSHGAQGLFFLATGMVGSCQVPWWDHIAYLLKTAQRRRFTLRYPSDLEVDMDRDGLMESFKAVLKSYRDPGMEDPARFIRELAEEAQAEDRTQTPRRFLNWDEAREMTKGGMAIGSHTHSHPELSHLEPDRQYEELSVPRTILKEQLGVEAETLAYPFGGRTNFTDETQRIARELGYRAAFSFYGGTNLPGRILPHNVSRIGVGNHSWSRFRVQTAVCRFTGRYWP
jgi:peptidoglycan/xylan/chitin deacetylase (PgdA/CDA1 family)